MTPIAWHDDNRVDNPSNIVAIGLIDGVLAFMIEDHMPNGYVLFAANGDMVSNHFFDSVQSAQEEARRQAQQSL